MIVFTTSILFSSLILTFRLGFTAKVFPPPPIGRRNFTEFYFERI